jgi:hypothetical protein
MNQKDIQVILKSNNLKLEGYKPGNTRLYAIYDYSDKKISDYMTFKELCAFLKGFEAGYSACAFNEGN